jgi:hypothetical protein
VAFVDDQDPVEQLAAQRSDHAFAEWRWSAALGVGW